MNFYRHLSAMMLMLIGTALLLGCGDNLPKSGGDNFSVESAYIQESGEHLSINAEYPILKGFPGADSLSAEIKKKVDVAANEVRNAAHEMENREGFSASLNSNYQYFHNKNTASLWMSLDNYTGGAHGLYWMDSYTFNTGTGETYTFPGLFNDASGGVEYVTDKILRRVAVPEEGFFEGATDTVAAYEGNYSFLINGNELVAYFGLYDITPYVAGMQSFSFSADELRPFLKPEIFDAMQGQEPVLIQFLPKPES